MIGWILGALGAVGLFLWAKKATAEPAKPAEPEKTRYDILSLLSFPPFKIVPYSRMTARVLAPAGLSHEEMQKRFSKASLRDRLLFGPKMLAQVALIKQNIPVPPILTGQPTLYVDLWDARAESGSYGDELSQEIYLRNLGAEPISGKTAEQLAMALYQALTAVATGAAGSDMLILSVRDIEAVPRASGVAGSFMLRM